MKKIDTTDFNNPILLTLILNPTCKLGFTLEEVDEMFEASKSELHLKRKPEAYGLMTLKQTIKYILTQNTNTGGSNEKTK